MPSVPWTRLIRFLPTDSSTPILGEPTDSSMDVGLAYAAKQPIKAYVLDGRVPWEVAKRTGEVKTVGRLLAPLSAEQCGTIRCIGLNYSDHAAEMKLAIPTVPVIFMKPAASLAHPSETIRVPPAAQNDDLDYEVEFTVVIGQTCRDVTESEALGFVCGYTAANDLTARKQQKAASQWGFAKGFDQFCPVGPCLVNAATAPDPQAFPLKTILNGKVMQDGSTSKMIFGVAQTIAFLSQGTTLHPGTLIITGTPPGIGDGRNPKVWLKDGDDVRCWVGGGIGTLVNTMEYEGKAKAKL